MLWETSATVSVKEIINAGVFLCCGNVIYSVA